MKQVVVRPAAAADIEDAYRWYESQRPGLGEEFLGALRVTRDRVLEQPEAFPVLRRNTRRVLIPQRFPYGLVYRYRGLHAREARPAAVATPHLMANSALQRAGRSRFSRLDR